MAHDSIPEHIKENYAYRVARGETWEAMAEQFVKDGYDDLAAWAKDCAKEAEKVVDEVKPKRARKETAKDATPTETAVTE